MDILLAFLLYNQFDRQQSPIPLCELRPFLPPQTQRGLAAMEAYNSSRCAAQPSKEHLFEVMQNSTGSKFPFLLLRMLTMGGMPDANSPEGLFEMLKCLLPPETLANMPDPSTLMNMMNIMMAMNNSDGDCDDDCCDDDCCDDSSHCEDEAQCCDSDCSCDEPSEHEVDDCRSEKKTCPFSGEQTSFFTNLLFR